MATDAPADDATVVATIDADGVQRATLILDSYSYSPSQVLDIIQPNRRRLRVPSNVPGTLEGAMTRQGHRASGKLMAAVHYICGKVAAEPDKLGAVKLHKILWFADIKSYQMTGQTITGGTFIKHQHGPFLSELDEAVRDLEQRQFIGKDAPDTQALSDRERKWLDEFIKELTEKHTASSISERTHNRLWKTAEMFEQIPVGAAAIQFIKLGPEAMEWAVQELERMGA